MKAGGQGNGGDNGDEGGGLPITGAPIFTIAAAGIMLILIGIGALWCTRRVRWVAKSRSRGPAALRARGRGRDHRHSRSDPVSGS